MIVYTTCNVFVQACGDFRSYFFLIKDCKYNSFTPFFYVFFICLSLLCRRTWWRPRRQAGLKTTGVAGTCKHEVIIFVASMSATVVKQLFLQCSSFERASRSLAKTGLFFGLFLILFFVFVFCSFLGGLGGDFWRP